MKLARILLSLVTVLLLGTVPATIAAAASAPHAGPAAADEGTVCPSATAVSEHPTIEEVGDLVEAAKSCEQKALTAISIQGSAKADDRSNVANSVGDLQNAEKDYRNSGVEVTGLFSAIDQALALDEDVAKDLAPTHPSDAQLTDAAQPAQSRDRPEGRRAPHRQRPHHHGQHREHRQRGQHRQHGGCRCVGAERGDGRRRQLQRLLRLLLRSTGPAGYRGRPVAQLRADPSAHNGGGGRRDPYRDQSLHHAGVR